MNFAEYTQLALRTKSPTYTRDHLMMGLFGEAGEVVDLIKKVVAHGHPVTPELLAKARAEIGDVLWYVALGMNEDVKSADQYGDFDVLDMEGHNLYGAPCFLAPHPESLASLARGLRAEVWLVEVEGQSHYGAVGFSTYIKLCWTLHNIAKFFDTTLKQCAIENIEKLRKRYPDGFSSEASQARADVVVDGVVHGDLSDMWATAKAAATNLFGAPVVSKKFVLERNLCNAPPEILPWYLSVTSAGRVVWYDDKSQATQFNTTDEAFAAAGACPCGQVYRAKTITP